MSTATWSGMQRDSGLQLTDIDHIRQSVRDILLTPQGSRVMRRDYGSLLSALLDQPQNETLRLQIMSACYMALLRWEPRITLDSIRYQLGFDGSMEVALSGARNQSTFSLSIPVS
ncbi:GPW/gp25 family protein [Erwinia sp. LJJL01]|uniref:GPW/gp25 family protein n=1 Tax=Erwinia sp. LJJL01 TaxID=3391839 RepID=UPI00105F300B